ncbi:phosphohydrolase [Candidatus Micrarchaeota archaeon]|nr:MAG: phosphohydrolase [Candidatus Micrarchaeota archaeon]
MHFVTEKGELVFEKLKRFLKKDKNRTGGHGLDHMLRVWQIGTDIGKKEGANLEVLEPALLLHDIVHEKGKSKEHAIKSAEKADEILAELGYSAELRQRICNAIRRHSRSDKRGGIPQTLEDKIVYDADKIDAVGREAVERVKDIQVKKQWSNEEAGTWYLERIIDVLKEAPPYTKYARKIIKEKLPISIEFCFEMLGKDKFYSILEKHNAEEIADFLVVDKVDGTIN